MSQSSVPASPLRILHVVYSFGIGGSETVAREVALRLGEQGHANMVVALEHDGPLSGEFRSAGIAAHALNRGEGSMLGAMYRLFRLVREFRPHALHTHHMYMLFHAVPAAVLTRTPIVHTEHEFWSLDTAKGRLLMPFLARFCRWITAVNDETRQFMEQRLDLSGKLLVTVRNGIDIKRFSGTGTLRRADMGLGSDDRVAVIVARLEPVKNHHMLLRAWQQVVREVAGAKLLVAGTGSLAEALRDDAAALGLADSVHFLGPRRDVHEILPLADMAVLSSCDEGLPLFLLEAMAAGLPVVSTRVGGVPRLISEGENGHMVDEGDEQALAQAVAGLLNDPSRASRMGAAGRRRVEAAYDLDAAVGRYLDLYRGGE